MGNRRLSRELALKALFYFDINKENNTRFLDVFCSNFQDEIKKDLKVFFLDIVNGVMEYKQEIDLLLEKNSKNWKITRMPLVDRNIMRIAIFEFLKRPDIPARVSINEAIELGKKYGTQDSGSFINGVLDRINSENI